MNEANGGREGEESNAEVDFGRLLKKWSDIHERKTSVFSVFVDLLKSAAQKEVALVVTGLLLCVIVGLFLHFRPDANGMIGTIVIAVLVTTMGIASKGLAQSQHGTNSKAEGELQTKPGNER